MKKSFKYIIAVLMTLELSVCFIPILSCGNENLTFIDVLKIGIGKNDNSKLLNAIADGAGAFVQSYIYMEICMILLVLAGALLTCLQNEKSVYIFAGISQILVNVFGVVLYSKITGKVLKLKEAGKLWKAGKDIEVENGLIIVWITFQILIFGIIVCGMLIDRISSKKEEQSDMILPEDCGGNRVKTEDKIPVENDTAENNKGFDVKQRFTGAILGRSEIYREKAYPLEELQVVYFTCQNQQIILEKKKTEEILAEVYYIPQYQEYCLKPARSRCIFLESGQPLGGEKEYYLPRMTGIYIRNAEHGFFLA